MTEIAFYSDSRKIEENQDLTRKIKRMKLSNTLFSPSKKPLTGFNLSDENIQKMFPFIGEDVYII